MAIGVFRASDDYEYKTVSSIIYPVNTVIVNPLNYLETGYTTKTTAVSFPSMNYKETLNFTNYADYFLTDIYYRIPLEQFDIDVTTNYPELPPTTGRMIITKGAKLFPNLTSTGSNVVIELMTYKKGDKYRIVPSKPLYVNPNNLQMSSTPIDGYVATNNIYYPVNQTEDFQGLKFTFNIYQFGYSETNLSWISYCYSSSSFIGACSNSEY